MPQKKYSIYNQAGNFSNGQSDHLVVEVGESHLACMVIPENKSVIDAFELFTIERDDTGKWDEKMAEVFSTSTILGHKFATAHVYINNVYSLPVPALSFNEDFAADYLNCIYGEDYDAEIMYEHLPIMPGMVNVFRCNNRIKQFLNQKLHNIIFHHSHSIHVKRLLRSISTFHEEVIALQFYPTFFLVIVCRSEELLLVQQFSFDTSEDILYHVFNIKAQLNLSSSSVLHVGGLITTDDDRYIKLAGHFSRIIMDDVLSISLPADISKYPAYYFSPFFNLVA